ncbi:hypothetical protein [Microvirga terricola]|uniref:Uncharacterized protein n=1 Tax=Microvirga terricola TaxID=2719797 RepID=A0ABX0VEC8_9HYPH|nr:hypothetical protein [Microvirga terricola]NIX78189.1 hypothetical protein [Microvirga terricola]
MSEQQTNVVMFRPRKGAEIRYPAKSLLERVYAAGSIAVAADDIATKTAATMLEALGLLVIEQVQINGTIQPVIRGQATGRPWRLSKPAFTGRAGAPDGMGAFLA